MLQQQQVNGVPRPPGAGLPPVQGVPQIRSQVNISQQQRMPTPLAAGSTRMSPQQAIHAQAQQARAMAQAQAAQNAVSSLNGIMGNSHLSPPYVARAASSSPGLQRSSPPRNSTTPSNASNPPRPPSAQQQVGMIPVPGNSMPRPVSNMGQQYFPPIPNMPGQQQFTPEQMERVLRAVQVCRTKVKQISIFISFVGPSRWYVSESTEWTLPVAALSCVIAADQYLVWSC
jgi:chromatin modification-related protein VID21